MLEEDGREWFRSALDGALLSELVAICNMDDAPGQRLTLDPPDVLNALAQRLLPGACPVRVVAFNKTETNNWTLPWHQDRVIALCKRAETTASPTGRTKPAYGTQSRRLSS